MLEPERIRRAIVVAALSALRGTTASGSTRARGVSPTGGREHVVRLRGASKMLRRDALGVRAEPGVSVGVELQRRVSIRRLDVRLGRAGGHPEHAARRVRVHIRAKPRHERGATRERGTGPTPAAPDPSPRASRRHEMDDVATTRAKYSMPVHLANNDSRNNAIFAIRRITSLVTP